MAGAAFANSRDLIGCFAVRNSAILDRYSVAFLILQTCAGFCCVDNRHIEIKKELVGEFTKHINSLDPNIKFTSEE